MKMRYLLALGLMVISPAALALDAEYVVMGGFTTIVNAFTRVKLMFNDNQYQMLVAAFVVLGAVSGLLIKSAKGSMEYLETGKGQMGVGWLGMTILGTMLYFGLVQNKGTIHIYDQSRNQYQAVSGIPDLMITLAGVTNQVYQAFVDMANRNTATTTRFTGEGTPIKMLLGMLNRNGAQFDPYLTANIKFMWNQCAPIAQARGFDPHTLKTGSAVLDVVSALAPLRNQAAYTVWYSPSNPAGASITCDQAYVTLKSDLGNPAAYSAKLQDICVKNGYQSGNAVQLADCRSRMEEGLQTIFGASGLSLNTAMSNVVVSQAITDAMLQNNPDVAATMLANRSMINGGMADAVTNPEWLSSIMSGVIAIILAVTPMLLLLCFTPIMGKAFTLMTGLWVFITVWQVADVVLLQASMDEILTAMNDLRSMGLGIDAMQLGPTSAMKSMAVMASARESAVTVAVIVSSLFGISAYGLSGFGQKAMSRLDRVTEETSDKAFTNEGRAGQIDAMRRGEAGLKTAGEFGGNIDMMSNASAFRDSSDIYSANSQTSALGGTSMASQRAGAVDAGRSVGNTLGYENGNAGAGFSNAAETSMISAQASMGESLGQKDAAMANDSNVADQSRLTSGVGNTIQTADAKSNIEHAGGTLAALSSQQSQVHGTERQVQIGSAEGTQAAASATGKSVTQFTSDKTAVDSVSDHASGQGRLQAAGGTLEGLHSREAFTAAAEGDERTGHATALHTAYDSNGGIVQGVGESQGEHLTQNLHDMREQKDNVQEIQNATGKSEGAARHLLAESRSAEQMGVMQGNNYDPRQMQENSAWSTEKGASVIKGEKKAYEERGESMTALSERRGEREVHQGIALHDKFDTLSKAMGGDKAASEALENAGTALVVTRPEAEQLGKNNLMQPTQVEAIPEDGVGTAHISMRQDAEGRNMSAGSVQAGNSTNVDNSYHNDSGQTLGSDGSALQLLSQPQSASQFVAASERSQPGSSVPNVAIEASRALSPFYKESVEQMNQNSTTGTVSVGTPALGKLFGFDAGASAKVEKANMHNNNYDLMTAMFQTRVGGYRDEAIKDADAQKLEGAQREKFITDSVGTKSSILFNSVKAGIPKMLEEQSVTPKVNDLHREAKPPVFAQGQENQSSTFSRGGISDPQAYLEQYHKNAEQREHRANLPITQVENTQHGAAPVEQPKPAKPEDAMGRATESNSQSTSTVAPVNAAEQQQPAIPYEHFNGNVGNTPQSPMQSQYRPEHRNTKALGNEAAATNGQGGGDDLSSSAHPPVTETGSEKGIPVEATQTKATRGIPQ